MSRASDRTVSKAAVNLCDRLAREVMALRNALEPFARIPLARDHDAKAPDMIEAPDLSITPTHVRAARSALDT